jgi:plastocyanin
MEDVVAALQQPDPTAAFALLTFVGGPTGIPPGGEQEVSAVLEPGMHVLLCFVPAPDGVPHLAKGMIAQLEVTEGASGELPAGDAELTLQDFAFVGLDTLPAGEQVVRVTNDGPQPHEATVVRLTEGVTVPDIIGMLSASPAPDGPPPWTSAGGVAALADGLDATMTLDLEPGNYAFVCFVPDPASGKAHVELGMIGELTVQ